MRRGDLVVGFGLVVILAGTWFPALLANLRGTFPTWGLVVLVVLLAVAVLLVLQWRMGLPEPEHGFTRWRHHRIVRRLVLAGDDEHGVSLAFELVRGGDTGDGPVVLRCHGVADLRLRQPWQQMPDFGGVRCEDRGPARRDGQRYRIHDVWNEGLSFTCREFECVAPPATGR